MYGRCRFTVDLKYNRRRLARKLNFRIFRTDSNSVAHNLCSTVCERHEADARKMQKRARFSCQQQAAANWREKWRHSSLKHRCGTYSAQEYLNYATYSENTIVPQ